MDTFVGFLEVVLRFHSQQHPETTESENKVGKPGGDEGRQPVDAAELVEELKRRRTEDSDSEEPSSHVERAFCLSYPDVRENRMPMMAMINETMKGELSIGKC